MKDFFQNCLAVLFMLVLLAGIAWMAGITPDGVLYGHWPDTDDHPTNWYDSDLHPDAR